MNSGDTCSDETKKKIAAAKKVSSKILFSLHASLIHEISLMHVYINIFMTIERTL
jgi:hypothetical protein